MILSKLAVAMPAGAEQWGVLAIPVFQRIPVQAKKAFLIKGFAIFSQALALGAAESHDVRSEVYPVNAQPA